MIFEWDSKKAESNLKKHGVSFNEARSAFMDENAMLYPDPEHSDSEDRFLLFGYSEKNRLLLVVHCTKAEDHVRIISARRATKKEHKIHEERIK